MKQITVSYQPYQRHFLYCQVLYRFPSLLIEIRDHRELIAIKLGMITGVLEKHMSYFYSNPELTQVNPSNTASLSANL